MRDSGLSIFWIIAAANVLLVAPLIFFLMQAARRARTEKIRAEAERIRFQENEQRLRSMLDRRQALQHAVAKVLAGASTVEQAVPDLLQAIVVNLDWHAGLFWRVQDDRQTIICAHGWSVDTTVMQDFLRRSGQEAHTSGPICRGTAGLAASRCGWRVWQETSCLRVDLSKRRERCMRPASFRFG